MTTLAQKMILAVSQPTNTDDLRALYAEVKSGAAMPHALVHAAINNLADKGCAARARKAFEGLGLGYGPQHAASLDDLAAAAGRGDFLAVVKLSCGTRSDLWAAAMTAHYGPTGTHESRCNADGTPKAETLAAFPRIGAQMAEARERVIGLIECYRRAEQLAA